MKHLKIYEEMTYNVEFEYNIDEYITLKEHDNWVINITAKIKILVNRYGGSVLIDKFSVSFFGLSKTPTHFYPSISKLNDQSR